MAKFFAAIALSMIPCNSANAFLKAQESEYVAKEDLEHLVLSGLSGFADAAHLQAAQDEMRDMFVALPKGKHGNLEPSSVRYALHRYFVQKHGWYIRGLERADTAKTTSSASIMKDRAPAFILSLFEDRMLSDGLGLHDLAVFAISLAQLIHAEAVGKLANIFKDLKISTEGPLIAEQLDLGLKAYILKFTDNDWEHARWKNASQVEDAENDTSHSYLAYNDTKMWARDMFQDLEFQKKDRLNPFLERPPTKAFGEAVALAQQFEHRYGGFQEFECHRSKNLLMKKDAAATGRVLLGDFYNYPGVAGKMFQESPAFLRNQGVLDETDVSRPRLLIANYITSESNCLTTSGFYSVCCANECNALMSQLERKLASSSAPSRHIAEVVSKIRSDTVDAPRNLSDTLLARLDEIAEFNEGLVPLHGRLFTQWMHHAYPRECPFPARADAERPMTLEEWKGARKPTHVTVQQKQKYSKQAKGVAASGIGEELHWAAEEELVNDDRWTSASLQSFMAIVALISFALPLVRATAAMIADAFPDYSKAPAAMPERERNAIGSKQAPVVKKKKKPEEYVI